jgi:4-hydroxy 2-oxovalerate aldolase
MISFAQNHMIPMRKDIEWGYIIPYMITGMMNEHPRAAMGIRKTADKDDYAQFYKKMRDVVD